MNYENSAAILKALGHPARLKMMQGINQYGCHVNKMVEKLGLPQSTVSQHLAALRAAGLVDYKKDGVKCCYRVVDKKVMKIIETLGDLT